MSKSSSISIVNAMVLGLMALTIGYACFAHGGVTAPEWGYCMTAITLAALLVFAVGRTEARGLHPLLLVSLILTPAFVALQLIPLPLIWLRVVDPARAELLDGWNALGMGRSDSAPLSVAPSLTFAHLERLLGYLLTFFIARELRWRLPDRGWFLAAPVIAVGSLEGLLGLIQYLTGMGRAYGTYVNPNHFAALMHMALPMAVMGAALSVRYLRRESSATRVALSCLLLAGAAVLLFGALFSLSRTGLATVPACGLVLGFLSISKVRKGWLAFAVPAAILAAVLALVLISAPGALTDRFAAPGAGALTDDARAAFRKETLSLIAAYPWFGCGLGTYVSAIQKFRSSVPTALLDFAHNDYLQLVAELGVLGSIPLALGAGWIFAMPWRAARSPMRSRERYLAIACATSLTALALDCAVDFDFYIPANMLVAAWVAGIGAGGFERYFAPRREVPIAMSS